MSATHDSHKAADKSSHGKANKEGARPLAGPTVQMDASVAARRAMDSPAALTPANVMALQRTVGNAAVQRILAGRGQPQTPSAPFGVRLNTGQVIQPKLTVGPVNDKYEQEADRVARQVTRTHSQPQVQREVLDEEEIQASPLPGMQGGDIRPDVARSIQRTKGGGTALHDGARASMERDFGADFSGVRVHTGEQADTLNRSLSARAFTTGKDIFFGKGQYRPGSSAGQELIAHELTHTVQQGAVRVQRQPAAMSPVARDGHGAVVQRAPEWWEKHKAKKALKKKNKESGITQGEGTTQSGSEGSVSIDPNTLLNEAKKTATSALELGGQGKLKAEEILSRRKDSVDMSDPETARARETKLMKSMVKRGQRADAASMRLANKTRQDIKAKYGELVHLNSLVANLDNPTFAKLSMAHADRMQEIAEEITLQANSLEGNLSLESAKGRMMTGDEFNKGDKKFDWGSVELSASDAAMALEQNKFKIINYYSFLKMDHERISDHVNQKAILLNDKEWAGRGVVRTALASGLTRGRQAGEMGKAKPLSDATARLLLAAGKKDGNVNFNAQQGSELAQTDMQYGDGAIEQPATPQGKGNKYVDPSLRVGKGAGAKKVLAGVGESVKELGGTAVDAIAHPFKKNLYEKTIQRGSKGKQEVRHLRLIQGLELMALFQVQAEQRMAKAQQYLQDTEERHQAALDTYDAIDEAKKTSDPKSPVPSQHIQKTGDAWKAVTDTGVYRSTLKQYKLDVLGESKKYEKFGERAMVAIGRKVRTGIAGVLGGTVLNLLTGGLYRIEKKSLGGGYDVGFEGKSFIDDAEAAAEDYVRLTSSIKGGNVRGLGGKKGAQAYGVMQIIAKMLGLLKSFFSSLALFTLPAPPVSGVFASIALYATIVKAALELVLMIWAGIASKQTKDPRSRAFLKGKIAEHGIQFGTDMPSVLTAGVLAGVSGDVGAFKGEVPKGLFAEGGKYGDLINPGNAVAKEGLSLLANQGTKQAATVLGGIGSAIGTGVNDENVRNMTLNQQVNEESVKQTKSSELAESKGKMAILTKKVNSGLEVGMRLIGGGPGKGHGKRMAKRLKRMEPTMRLVRQATETANDQVQQVNN